MEFLFVLCVIATGIIVFVLRFCYKNKHAEKIESDEVAVLARRYNNPSPRISSNCNRLLFKRRSSVSSFDLPRKINHRKLSRRMDFNDVGSRRRKSIAMNLEAKTEDRQINVPPVIQNNRPRNIKSRDQFRRALSVSALHGFTPLSRIPEDNSPTTLNSSNINILESQATKEKKEKSYNITLSYAAIKKRLSKRHKGLCGDLSEFKSVFGSSAHDLLMKKHHECGPMYKFCAFGQKMHFLFDFNDIETLKHVEGRCPHHIDFKHLRIYRENKGFPQGVLISNGHEWKRQRKILSKLLIGTLNTAKYIPAIDEVVCSTIDFIDELYGQQDGVFIPETLTGKFAVEAFGRVLYGNDLGCVDMKMANNMQKIANVAKRNFEDAKKLLVLPDWLIPMHPAWRRHNERWDFLLNTTMTYIEKFEKSGKFLNECLLSQLKGTSEMDDGELIINFTDLMLASIDTTSNLLQWCLYELGTHSKSQEEAFKDAVNHLKGIGDATNIVQELPYIRAVVKETLRLHPVGFFTSRITKEDMVLHDVKIPAKSHVAVSMYVMGRNPKMFPFPDSFIPERWLGSKRNHDRYYNDVPFGFGPRMCLGKRIAEIQTILFLMHFCHRFQFEVMNNDIEHRVKLLLVPNKPIYLRLFPRKKCQ